MAIESTGNNTLLVNIDNNVSTVLTNQSSQSTTLSTINTNVSSTLTVAQSIQTSAGKIVYAVFTASGTWTRPSGVSIVDVLLVGGGGGGGPTAASNRDSATTAHAVVGGGGAGGQVVAAQSIYVGSYSSLAVTVGAGGSGGSVSGSGTSAITMGYSQDGSPTFIVGNTDTVAIALGGSFGAGAYDETGNGITYSLTGTAPSGNGFNVGGRAYSTTNGGSNFTFTAGGSGSGVSTSGLNGIDYASGTADYTESWQGAGFFQGFITQVQTSAVNLERSKIKYSNLVAAQGGGTIIPNFTSTVFGSGTNTSVVATAKNTAIGTRLSIGANNPTGSWTNGTNWFLSELNAIGNTGLVGSLPVGMSFATSTINTQAKLSLSSPGYGINGYGNGGWGGIIVSNSFTNTSFNSSSYIASGSFATTGFGTGNVLSIYPGPYKTRTKPNLLSHAQTSMASTAVEGTAGIANTGDGGNGSISMSFTSAAVGVCAKGGDGGSGICIISYSV